MKATSSAWQQSFCRNFVMNKVYQLDVPQPTDESASEPPLPPNAYPTSALLSTKVPDKTCASWAEQMLLCASFFTIFLVLEMASKTAQGWPGAPAFYLPLGLVIALFLWGGLGYWPLVFFSALVGAVVNYHRPLMSWCGVPGVAGVYCFYAGGAAIARKWWRIDPRLATVGDVGRLALTFLTCAIPTAIIGMLTLLGDGLISRADAIKTAVNWWESDSIAIISFAPLLLIYGSTRLTDWMRQHTSTRYFPDRTTHRTFTDWLMIGLQGGSVLVALWLVFFCNVAIPYQPVYILFIPVIWIAVQHGLPGVTIATCVINVSAMFTADATHSAGTALPRLQLAMLALALTGLCVGAAVSERKRVEEALEKSESNLRHAQQVATVGSWHVNILEDELSWSEETYRLFNLPREMPIDINLVEKYIHPDDRATFRTRWAAAFSTGRYEYEHRMVVDGVTKWVRALAQVEFDKQHCPITITGTVQDITDRKWAEEALRQAEEKYHALFEDAVVGMYQSTPDGFLLTVNRALAKMFGFSSSEEMLAEITEIPRVNGDGFKNPEDFKQLLETKSEVRDLEYEVRRPDGKQLWILENARTISGSDGNALFIEGALLDISQRKFLEAQLRQAQKMEAIGRLAGGVAHDFNNALGVMMGYCELAQLSLSTDSPLHKNLSEIIKAGNRASSLTRQLLAFSRKQAIEPVVLDLNSVVSDTEKMLRRLIGEDIELTMTRDPKLKRVKADKGQIEQILMNLVVNARDAMPRGGRLAIETANIEFREPDILRHSFLKPGRFVVLSVADTGCGMSQDVQAHIFEPFFTTKDPDRGTGLGLSTVYGIVKRSNGFLLVESEIGKGTIFKVCLPQVDEVNEVAQTVVENKFSPKGIETVLLVEDEASLLRLASGCLSTCGYNVLQAHDGQDALEVAARYRAPIHLLLTDVIMPGISGRELAENLRLARPEVKILYMSGYTHDLVTQQGILETGSELLHKPFAINALLAKVRDVLDDKALHVVAQ